MGITRNYDGAVITTTSSFKLSMFNDQNRDKLLARHISFSVE